MKRAARKVAGALALDPRLTDEDRNFLVLPATSLELSPGALVHGDARLEPGHLEPARVHVVLGPGATLTGVGERLFDLLYSAGSRGISRAEAARAVATYAAPRVRSADDLVAGLQLPLPVERSGDGWVIDEDALARWAMELPVEALGLLTARARPLPLPITEVPAEEQAPPLLAAPTEGARTLARRLLANPCEPVMVALEALRLSSAAALTLAIELGRLLEPELPRLALVAASHAVLRRLWFVLHEATAPTPAAQAVMERVITALSLALGLASETTPPSAVGPSVRPLDTPDTAAQRKYRGDPADAFVLTPPKGVHRVVWGRDVALGSITARGNFKGPWIGGELDPRDLLSAQPHLLNPDADPIRQARLELVAALAATEAMLDGLREADAGGISVGMQQWTMAGDDELTALLADWRTADFGAFDALLGSWGLDVAPIAGGFTMLRVPAGKPPVAIPRGVDRLSFFGGPVKRRWHFEDSFRWPARFRALSLFDRRFQAMQLLTATRRIEALQRKVPMLHNGRAEFPLEKVLTSTWVMALALDQHVNSPGYVRADLQSALAGIDPDDDQAFDRFQRSYASRRRIGTGSALRNQRNAKIAQLGLDTARGSFRGWER